MTSLRDSPPPEHLSRLSLPQPIESINEPANTYQKDHYLDMGKQPVPNPFPTPEEPVYNSFVRAEEPAVSRHVLQTTVADVGVHEKGITMQTMLAGHKRTFEEIDDARGRTNSATTPPNVHSDFELFSEDEERQETAGAGQAARALQDIKEGGERWMETTKSTHEHPMLSPENSNASSQDVNSPDEDRLSSSQTRDERSSKHKLGYVSPWQRYARDPQNYKMMCLAELALRESWGMQPAAAMPSTPRHVNKRRKVEKSGYRSSNRALEMTPPAEGPFRVSRTGRPSRLVQPRTPLSNKLTTPLVTPPPTKQRHGSTVSKKLAGSVSAEINAAPSKPGKPAKAVNRVKIVKAKPQGQTEQHGILIKTVFRDRTKEGCEAMGFKNPKAAYGLWEGVYIPPVDMEVILRMPDYGLPALEREVPSKALEVSDPMYSHLHEVERRLAERIRSSPSEYITQKRRYFLGLREWYRIGHVKFGKSHAQWFCNQDGNNSSYMYRTFEAWGMNARFNFPDELLRSGEPFTKLPTAPGTLN